MKKSLFAALAVALGVSVPSGAFMMQSTQSPDTLFHVKCVSEMGQVSEYYCTAYEENERKITLYFNPDSRSEKTVLFLGNFTSIDIRKIPRKHVKVPTFMKLMIYNVFFPVEQKGLQAEIAVKLGSIAQEAVKSYDPERLRDINNSLSFLIRNEPGLSMNTAGSGQETLADPVPDSRQYYICAPSGIVREENSFNARIKNGLVFGTKLNVLETDGDWFKIRLDPADAGWVHRKIVVDSEEKLKQYAGPGSS
jgi:hypothetical protein